MYTIPSLTTALANLGARTKTVPGKNGNPSFEVITLGSSGIDVSPNQAGTNLRVSFFGDGMRRNGIKLDPNSQAGLQHQKTVLGRINQALGGVMDVDGATLGGLTVWLNAKTVTNAEPIVDDIGPAETTDTDFTDTDIPF
jgi:hypothetical protein